MATGAFYVASDINDRKDLCSALCRRFNFDVHLKLNETLSPNGLPVDTRRCDGSVVFGRRTNTVENFVK